MTADTEEQWIRGQLPVGAEFDTESASDLERLVPDCGYKLRSIEIVAVGRVTDMEHDPVFEVAGGGATFVLDLNGVSIPEGKLALKGSIIPPFDSDSFVVVESLTATLD